MLKVLLAPLDWGLGHATRCIPIVKELINQRCTVIIAAKGAQKAVLQDEFPSLSFVEIPGFRIKYGKNRAFTLLKILFQIPKILIGIKREKQWIRQFARQEGLDLVVSDNRYGLYSGGVVSVFITHQLAIRSSLGGLVDGWLRRMNYSLIRRFSVCWVPDVEGHDGLAGKLSHPAHMPDVPVRYIGWLSRLESASTPPLASSPRASSPEPSGPDPIDLLILLSGPEPQRTILESLLLTQLSGEMGRTVVVRGLPNGGPDVNALAGANTPEGLQVFDYLRAQDLTRTICRSRTIVARSGYSTVMDLATLGKPAIFVPTPGQPEQEYLGRYLEQRGLAICVNQRRLVLNEAIRRSHLLTNRPASPAMETLKKEVARVLALTRSQSAAADFG